MPTSTYANPSTGVVSEWVPILIALGALLLSLWSFFRGRLVNRGLLYLSLRERYGNSDMHMGLRALGMWWESAKNNQLDSEVDLHNKRLLAGDEVAARIDAGRRVVKRYFEDAYWLKELNLLNARLFGRLKRQAGHRLLLAVWHLEKHSATVRPEDLDELRKMLEAYGVPTPE